MHETLHFAFPGSGTFARSSGGFESRSLDNPGRRTDTTDTVFLGTAANWRNYRNSSLRADVLVTCLNTGYYLHL